MKSDIWPSNTLQLLVRTFIESRHRVSFDKPRPHLALFSGKHGKGRGSLFMEFILEKKSTWLSIEI